MPSPEMTDRSILTRVPPQNNDAEIAVLCCCLDSQKVIPTVAAYLIADDFYTPAHQKIFETIYRLYSESKSIDLITVGDELKKQGELDKVGGMAYLSTIVDAHALLSNLTEYCRIVRQKSLSRKIIKSMEDLTRQTYEGETDPGNLIEIAISRLAELRDSKSDDSLVSLKDVLKETVANIVNPPKDKVVRSHFTQLDYVTNGFRPGTLTIVAARPSMGKSAFVINIAVNVALKDNLPVAFFSLEMNAQEIANRILASRCDISISTLQRSKSLSSDEFTRINASLPRLGNTPLYIDEHSGLNTAEILTRCRELQNRLGKKLGLICIDYLQLMNPVSERKNASRQQEVSDISRALKLMAKELEVPIIALAQLSRESERRDDHRPILSDLRDSGAIEQDADMVMFIHRPDYYKHKEESDEEEENNTQQKFKKYDAEEIQRAMIIVAKNRQGPTRDVYLSWNGSRTTFFEKEKADPNAVAGPSDADAPPPWSDEPVPVPEELFGEPSLQIPDAVIDSAPAAPAESAAPAAPKASLPPIAVPAEPSVPPIAATPAPSPSPSAPVPKPAPNALDAALFGGDSEMEFEELDSIDWSSDSYGDPGESSEPGYFDDPGQF
ncbi:MAG: replicative DNA helicase [Clostridiales bacterium]|nr:replicative DNA helicase [Clostridiales bacterium]